MSTLAFRSTAPAPVIDLDVVRLVLDVRGRTARSLDARVQNSIVDGELERTTDGASTLRVTLHDPDRTLLRSGLFSHTIDAKLDRFWFRLVQVSKQDDQLALTFEDRDVARLRAVHGPRKTTTGHGRVKPKLESASRAHVTRAEFALALVRELHPSPTFVCPQLHKRQAVAASTTTPSTSAPKTKADGTYNAAELQTLWLQAGGAQAVAETMAAIALAESSGRAAAVGGPNRNGTYDYGCWQINSVHGYSKSKLLALDQSYNARCAVAIYKAQGLRAWSTYSSGAYRGFLHGSLVAGVSDSREARRTVPYQYRRGAVDGRIEDSWACLQRLASEVNWRCFVNEGRVYFVTDEDLLALSKPVTVSERTIGVSTIDFDIDNGKVTNEVTISARASRWAADPGTVVKLTDLGPANGTWLVHSMRRGLYDADATITLRKRGKQLKEPAAETEDVPMQRTRDGYTLGKLDAVSSTGEGSSDSGATNAVEASYAAAISIHNHQYPYVWGGGHARAGVADRGTGRDPGIGYDCSGAVCAVLAAGGLGLRPNGPAPTSGPLMSWGASGPGRYLTVYSNDVHVFIVFHTSRGNQHFGTGRWGKSWGGAGFNPTMHTLSGFVARHWPGT